MTDGRSNRQGVRLPGRRTAGISPARAIAYTVFVDSFSRSASSCTDNSGASTTGASDKVSAPRIKNGNITVRV